MAIKSGLGIGLESLIPTNTKTVTKNINNNIELENNLSGNKVILEIDVDKIFENPYQPRKKFDQSSLEDLANSIKEQGILQPLVVTRKGRGEYELVAGERRLKASKIAGFKKVSVIVKELSDQKKMEAAFVENIQRENLNTMEEAKTCQNLKDKFDLTTEEIAHSIGKSRETVSNSLRMLSLPAEVQRYILNGDITKALAMSILKVSDSEKQILLAKEIMQKKLSQKEVEKIVNSQMIIKNKKTAIAEVDKHLLELEKKLSEGLKTKVKITGKTNKGKIVIDFFSEEELGEIMEIITHNIL